MGRTARATFWFPDQVVIAQVLANHRAEAERWPLQDVIPISLPQTRRQQVLAPRPWTPLEREIIEILIREPRINAVEISGYFAVGPRRARLIVAEAAIRRGGHSGTWSRRTTFGR